MALKKLNEDIRRAKKAKARPKRQAPAVPPTPPIDFAPLVAAIENSKQPVVNIEQREPVAYRFTVDINSRGDMVGAVMEPITDG